MNTNDFLDALVEGGSTNIVDDRDERRNDMQVLTADAEEISHQLSELARHIKRDAADDRVADLLAAQCAAAQTIVDSLYNALREEARR